ELSLQDFGVQFLVRPMRDRSAGVGRILAGQRLNLRDLLRRELPATARSRRITQRFPHRLRQSSRLAGLQFGEWLLSVPPPPPPLPHIQAIEPHRRRNGHIRLWLTSPENHPGSLNQHRRFRPGNAHLLQHDSLPFRNHQHRRRPWHATPSRNILKLQFLSQSSVSTRNTTISDRTIRSCGTSQVTVRRRQELEVRGPPTRLRYDSTTIP